MAIISAYVDSQATLYEFSDPLKTMWIFFGNSSPVDAFARDVHAVPSISVDWKETEREHVFKADMPGLEKEEIDVIVEGRTLSISGQRIKEEVQKTDTWHRAERSSGPFMRNFKLPENADLDHVTATLEHGVLTVIVPKLGAPQH